MRNYSRVAWLVLVPFVWIGCQTASPPLSLPVSPSPPEPVTVVTVPEPIVVAPPQPILPEPLITNVPPATSRWPSNWLRGWIPLESWSQWNGLGPPIRLRENPGIAYEIRTTNGLLKLRMDQRAMRLGGVECWLSYAPQWIRGMPCVYALDAQKTLQPLATQENPVGLNGRTVVVDPGHGGKDAGTPSVFGREYEKYYTLDWALRVRRLLATNGWTVLLTRTNDTEVSLPERVAFAERANADLFLSLHFNSGTNSYDRTGLETYCLTPAGLPSNLVRNHEDDPKQKFPNNDFDEQNLQWAFRLHRALVETTGAVDHGVRRARFMAVLRGQRRPAVLLEAGYLSNAQEARKIATAEYRQLLAEAVVTALE